MSARRASAAVRPAAVDVARIVVRVAAAAVRRIGDADRRHAVLHRDAVRARERAEVAVEGAVLLHDHDHVLDLVDAGIDRHPIRARAGARHPRRSARGSRREYQHSDDPPPARPTSRCTHSSPKGRENRRRGWDSNPRNACTFNGFQDRPVRPLRHPAVAALYHSAGERRGDDRKRCSSARTTRPRRRSLRLTGGVREPPPLPELPPLLHGPVREPERHVDAGCGAHVARVLAHPLLGRRRPAWCSCASRR